MLKFYIAGALIIAAIGAIWFFGSYNATVEPEAVVPTTQQKEPEKSEVIPPESQSVRIITITNEGYSPREMTVLAGEIVVFANQSARSVWTATAIHPTHTIYPGSNIRDCIARKVMFDSCTQIPRGEEWSFQFNEVGEWGYHNHLNPSRTGKIIVE